MAGSWRGLGVAEVLLTPRRHLPGGLSPVKCRSAVLPILLGVLGASVAAPSPSSATRYVPESQCIAAVHRAKLLPFDEEQKRGIRASVTWGWGAELDVRLTADNQLVLVHDDSLRRVSGGVETRGAEQLTLAEVTAVPLARGGRVITLADGVLAARRSGAKLMVEIKRHGRYPTRWDEVGLPALASTLRKLGMQDRVYVGGPGSVAYSLLAPGLPTFYRTSPDHPVDVAWIVDQGYDIVQLDPTHYDPDVIAQLRAAGIQVGSRQINTKASLTTAYAAGLRFFQADRGRLVQTWCSKQTSTPAVVLP